MIVSSRRHPDRPIIGVGAVVIDDLGRVVLMRRSQPPMEGAWSVPGGVLEIGETLAAGVVREVREETGLSVDVGPLLEIFELISHDEASLVDYHYVIVDYLCRVRTGTLRAGSDAAAVVAVEPSDLGAYDLTDQTTSVIRRAYQLAREPRTKEGI